MRAGGSVATRLTTVVLLLFVYGVLGARAPVASASVAPIPEPSCGNGGCFDVANAMAVDRHLSVDIGPRRVGTADAVAARDYLSEAMSTSA